MTLIINPDDCRRLIPDSLPGERARCLTNTLLGSPHDYYGQANSADFGGVAMSLIVNNLLIVGGAVLLILLIYSIAVASNPALTTRQKWGWFLLGLTALPLAIGLYLALSPAPTAYNANSAAPGPAASPGLPAGRQSHLPKPYLGHPAQPEPAGLGLASPSKPDKSGKGMLAGRPYAIQPDGTVELTTQSGQKAFDTMHEAKLYVAGLLPRGRKVD